MRADAWPPLSWTCRVLRVRFPGHVTPSRCPLHFQSTISDPEPTTDSPPSPRLHTRDPLRGSTIPALSSLAFPRPSPPPLFAAHSCKIPTPGTGNDLARALGWGGGLTGSASEPLALHILGDVTRAERTPFDLWRVQIQEAPPRPSVLSKLKLRRGGHSGAGAAGATQGTAGPSAAKAPAPQARFMVNYLCVGYVHVVVGLWA